MSGLALVLAAAMGPAPADPTYPLVRLEDAWTFGVSKEAVRPLWQLAQRNKSAMRETVCGGWNNAPDVCEAWDRESDWRQRCWFLLDDALYCDSLTPQQKLRSLDELRQLLGDDYYRGVMPTPTCSYRFAPEQR